MRKHRVREPIFPGAEYTADECAALAAVDAYRRRTGHKFPTLTELLDVLRALGWTPPARPPPPTPNDGEPVVPRAEPSEPHPCMGVQRDSRRRARALERRSGGYQPDR